MPVELRIDQIQQQLLKIRDQQGEEVYQKARHDIALSVILKPNGEAFVHNAFPDLDIEALKQEAAKRIEEAHESQGPSMAPEHVMLRLLQQQVPSIRTQGHFNLFAMAFDALRTTLDGYFSGDFERATRGREALNKALDMSKQAKDIIERLEEIPPEQRSKEASATVAPPKEFHEYDAQRQLLVELDGLTTREALNEWYGRTKSSRDLVVSQQLRNELLDRIRAKRKEFDDKGAN